MPNDTVPVDVAEAMLGWQVCHHYPADSELEAEPTVTDFIQYVKS